MQTLPISKDWEEFAFLHFEFRILNYSRHAHGPNGPCLPTREK